MTRTTYSGRHTRATCPQPRNDTLTYEHQQLVAAVGNAPIQHQSDQTLSLTPVNSVLYPVKICTPFSSHPVSHCPSCSRHGVLCVGLSGVVVPRSVSVAIRSVEVREEVWVVCGHVTDVALKFGDSLRVCGLHHSRHDTSRRDLSKSTRISHL